MQTSTRAKSARYSAHVTATRGLTSAFISVFILAGSALGVSFDMERPTDEEIDLVAQRLHDRVSGQTASAERQEERAASLDPAVRQLLEAQNRDEGSELCGAFAHVKPKDPRDIDFARAFFDPIRTLAHAYALTGSGFYRSKDVAKAMRRGFVYTRKHVYAGCEKPGNWWVWAKQMPGCLTDILALVSQDLPPEDRDYLVSILDYLVGKGPLSGSYYHHGKAGKDALNVLKLGVLSGDRERIARAWECMENEVGPYLLEEDGAPLMTVIKREFLGISLPYVYEGYDTFIEWMELTHGTRLALRPETIRKIADYLLGLGRWNTFKDTEVGWISFTAYRVFWRPARTLSLAGRLAGLGLERAEDLNAMAEGKDAAPDGIRFWPSAETLIYRSPEFYCALVMASRNRHQISWSYKNRFLHIGNKWYYGRDGHLVLAHGAQDTDPNLTYVHDWQRLSGVTRDDGSVLESDQLHWDGGPDDYWQPGYLYCQNPFAGAAVLDGRVAAAGIEVHSGAVRARKSYFFLRDQDIIVTLGSHIEGRGQTDTIVHTFPVHTPEPDVIVNGEMITLAEGEPQRIETPAWVFGRGGYYFPEKGAITILTQRREPDFSDHGRPLPEERPDVPPQSFVSVFFDHGTDPQDAHYACVYFPNAKRAQMPQLTDNFEAGGAYGRNKSGHFLSYGLFLGLVFFQRGELRGYQADRACFVANRTNGKEARLAVYEPSWTDCELNVGLPFLTLPADLAQNLKTDGNTLVAQVKAGRPFQCTLSVVGGTKYSKNMTKSAKIRT